MLIWFRGQKRGYQCHHRQDKQPRGFNPSAYICERSRGFSGAVRFIFGRPFEKTIIGYDKK
jgi:hypothetical protein